MAFMGTAPFGSFMAGILAKKIGVQHTILIGGITCILGALIFARKLSEIRKTIHPVYARLGYIPEEISSGIQAATEMTVPPKE